MLKFIRLFGLFVIICLIYGLGSAFNGNESTNNVDISKEKSTETVDNYNSEDYVSTESVDESNDYQIKNDIVVDKTENKDTINNMKEIKIIDDDVSFEEREEENKVEEKNEIITKPEIKEEFDNSSDKIENTSNDNNKPDDVNVNEDIDSDTEIEELPKEEVILEIDEEYERLKKLYKYKNGTECYYASLKAYSQTYQENYENAGCISGAYNGELVGYRIIIYFNDGTSMYYDEAI